MERGWYIDGDLHSMFTGDRVCFVLRIPKEETKG
jgi:hypothetical protein